MVFHSKSATVRKVNRASTARNLAWHEECLRNVRLTVEEQGKTLARMQADYARLLRDMRHRENQLRVAREQGVESFNGDKFLKGDLSATAQRDYAVEHMVGARVVYARYDESDGGRLVFQFDNGLQVDATATGDTVASLAVSINLIGEKP